MAFMCVEGMKRLRILSLIVLLCTHVAVAQKTRKKPPLSNPDTVTWPKVPVAQVTFKDDESLPVIQSASPVMEYPIQCGGGDRYFINMALPPDFTKSQLYSVSKSRGVIKYSLDAVSELRDSTVKTYSPTPSGVLFLVNATSEKDERHYISRGEGGTQVERTVHPGEHVDYFLKFDQVGAFQGKVEIDSSIRISRVAMFNSGTYLGIGLTQSDSSMHLMLFDENGGLLRLLEPPKQLAEIAQQEARSFGSAQAIVGLTPLVQFVPFNEIIYVVPSGSPRAIFEVRSSGEITVLQLKLPKGLSVGAVIPSTDHLYAWVASSKDVNDLTKAHLYEFDWNGGILRELKPLGASIEEIACEQNGAFVAFRLDQNGKLVAAKGQD